MQSISKATILRVLENDLPNVEDVSYSTIQKTIKMLMILAERVPLMPKMAELYRELETTRNQGLKMLEIVTYILNYAEISHFYSKLFGNVKNF